MLPFLDCNWPVKLYFTVIYIECLRYSSLQIYNTNFSCYEYLRVQRESRSTCKIMPKCFCKGEYKIDNQNFHLLFACNFCRPPKILFRIILPLHSITFHQKRIFTFPLGHDFRIQIAIFHAKSLFGCIHVAKSAFYRFIS